MYRVKLTCSIFLIFVCTTCLAGVIPVDGSKLNYTTVYFETDLQTEAKTYQLVLYSDSNLANIQTSLKSVLPAFWVPNLKWGSSYYWKIISYSKTGAEIETSTVHKFSILKIKYTGVEEVVLDVKINKKIKHKNGFITLDNTRSIYNRNGAAVWTLPEQIAGSETHREIRDLKVTQENSLTFFNGPVPTEIDLYGTVLWSAPFPFVLGTDTISYHHDFKKTKSGTYMVLGNKQEYCKLSRKYPDVDLANFEVEKRDSGYYCKVLMAVVLEFDKNGQLVWMWDSKDYIKDVDLNYKKSIDGTPLVSMNVTAFSLNAAETKIYVGFKDLSRIIKLDKKTKQVELSYGEKYPSGDAMLANSLFRKQFNFQVTNHNSILVFNNNTERRDQKWTSSVLEFKEKAGIKDSLLLWKFPLTFDTLTNGKSFTGGSVIELPNSNLLVCTGVMGRVFEVTKTKEIVWDAFVKAKQSSADTTWQNMPQYHCNWVADLKLFYFMATCKQVPPAIAGATTLKLAVHNTGSAIDTYSVEVFTEEKELIYKSKTGALKNASTSAKVLNINLNGKKTSGLNVIVTSVNSGRKSNLFVPIK